MHTNEGLPLVLVSANNSASAYKIISALIEDEATVNGHQEDGESRVWRLANKYYRADVRLQPLADGEPPPAHLADRVEAHIIYLSADEGEECAERRFVDIGELARASHVRLVLSEDSERSALAAWAARRRYELVSLAPPDGEDDEYDVQGLPRARAALHAHTWRGLVRLDRPDAPPPVSEDSFDSDGDSCDSWGSWQGRGEAREAGAGEPAERAEAFASMLSSLHERRSALGALADGERRRGAEALLHAFTSALAPPRRD